MRRGDWRFPVDKIHRPNAGSMLGQRLGQWTNIDPALGQCLVHAGLYKCRLYDNLILCYVVVQEITQLGPNKKNEEHHCLQSNDYLHKRLECSMQPGYNSKDRQIDHNLLRYFYIVSTYPLYFDDPARHSEIDSTRYDASLTF